MGAPEQKILTTAMDVAICEKPRLSRLFLDRPGFGGVTQSNCRVPHPLCSLIAQRVGDQYTCHPPISDQRERAKGADRWTRSPGKAAPAWTP
jgi:hypothetical protein